MAVAPAKAHRFWLFLPFAAVVVIAGAWSAFWLVAAQRAEAVITTWLQDEARRGRIHSCGERTSGGYPFRIEVRCTDPTVQLTTAEPARVLRAKELRGVAQVYDPGLIIAEISGPLAVSEPGQPPAWRAGWRLAQASLRGVAGRPERPSVAPDGINHERVDGAAPETWAAADHLEFHLRRNPEAPADKPRIDFAAQLAGATVPAAPLLAGKPLDAEVTALVSGLNDLGPKPAATRLKEWQAAGGRLAVNRLRVQQGDAVATAVGDVGLSAAGRPDGAFTITMAGFERLLQDVIGGQQGRGLQLGLMAGLAFLGRPAEIEGRRAISMALRINDGAVSLGPIPLGRVEPLY